MSPTARFLFSTSLSIALLGSNALAQHDLHAQTPQQPPAAQPQAAHHEPAHPQAVAPVRPAAPQAHVDHNDHHHAVEVSVPAANHARYIPTPTYYGRDRHAHRYYYSNYYTTRYIYVEPARPYVEVRCSRGTPIMDTVVGGVAGGLIGDQFGHGHLRTDYTVGGALLGAIIGQSIDRDDESCAYQALEYARPNTQVVWANPDANYAYTLTPGAITQSSNGQYCREYQAEILVGDQLQNGYGTACRMPDGSWATVN